MEEIINGFNAAGIKKIAQKLNRLLLSKDRILVKVPDLSFEGYCIKPQSEAEILFTDLANFVGISIISGAPYTIGDFREKIKKTNRILEIKCKQYFEEDSPVLLSPLLQ